MNPIIFTMTAGFMNGTYAFPIKYMKSWRDENIWLVFSPIAFLIMPWLCLTCLDSNIFQLLLNMPKTILFVLLTSGFLFGIGMIVFTFSLRLVGLGISFMLNISSSTVLATLLPIILMEPNKIFSWFGLAEISALLFFCLAILTSYFASANKIKNKPVLSNKSHSNAFLGIILGLLSGILTSAQGFSYAYSTTTLKAQLTGYTDSTVMNAPWIPIFTAAFIPYFTYFLFRSIQEKSLINIYSKKNITYPLLCLLMGVLYFGSLLVFSHASDSLGPMGAVIAWPLLMIFIILTSNFWSFVHGDWHNSSKITLRFLSISLLSLCMAIVALSIAAILNTHN
jgi:L-rhamnose-H+ transport protein